MALCLEGLDRRVDQRRASLLDVSATKSAVLCIIAEPVRSRYGSIGRWRRSITKSSSSSASMTPRRGALLPVVIPEAPPMHRAGAQTGVRRMAKSGLIAQLSLRRSGVQSTNRVARARHGMDQPAIEAIVDLLAQTVNVHVDDVPARLEIVGPRRFEQHRAGDDLAGVAEQLLEQEVFAALQLDHPTGTRDSTQFGVEFEVRDPKNGPVARTIAASSKGLQSRQKPSSSSARR